MPRPLRGPRPRGRSRTDPRMEPIHRELDRLSRRSRGMLLGQRLLQWFSSVIAVGFVLALVDYALRLPGSVRLVIGASFAATAAVWLFTRLRRAAAFRPTPAEMALRAERMYPQLGGLLAAALELSPATAQPSAHGRAFARATVERAQAAATGVEFKRLIDPTRTLRRLAVFAVAAAGLLAAAALAPQATATAAGRWLAPLGDAQWPKRFEVELGELPGVSPADAAIRFRGRVLKGDRPDLRVHASYRFVEPDGEPGAWRETLMSRQRGAETTAEGGIAGRYEAVIEPPPRLALRLERRSGSTATLQVRASVGDDTTATREVRVAARPAVERVRVELRPPGYASGLFEARTVTFAADAGRVATIAARVGTRVTLDVRFNKPIDFDALPALTRHLPGLERAHGFAAERVDDDERSLRASFELRGDLAATVHAFDRHGLELTGHRRYRFDATPDARPSAAIVDPDADRTVLASAVVDVAAVGRDDLGLESLVLEADAPAAPDAESGSRATQARRMLTLARETGRRSTLELAHRFDLAPLSLEPGDEVTLRAVARDVYELEGETHDPVASSPRRLRIIDEATLIDEMRGELAELRKTAVRLSQTQRRLRESPAEMAAPRQEDLAERIDRSARGAAALRERLDRNRLEAPAVRKLLEAAGGKLNEARAAARRAAERLASPEADEAAGREEQDRTRQRLDELVEMLDQGADAMKLRIELDRLAKLQDELASTTRELLPQTVGRALEDLDPALRESLKELAERQGELAERAEELVERFRSTASALSRQSESDRDQAAAAALAEAAAVAARRGLRSSMEAAEGALGENRLSSAGGDQDRALDTLSEMLEEMGSQQRRMREMLRRRIAELAERLRRAIRLQEQALGGVQQALEAGEGEAVSWAQLAEEQTRIRRLTMSLELEAAKSEETQAAAERLGAAAASQAEAVLDLREQSAERADPAERAALAALREALERVEAVEREQEEEQAERRREELREAYLALADRERTMVEAAQPLAEAEALSRRQRASLIAVGGEQAKLRDEAAALGERVGETLVFKHLHDRIDVATGRAARLLNRGLADAELLRNQRRAEAMLRQMAEALAREQREEEFEQPAGGGGGGGGGGKKPPLVPPLAELKLLRSVQSMLLSETAALEAAASTEAATRSMMRIAAEQAELAELGERLIEKMKQRNQPPSPSEDSP